MTKQIIHIRKVNLQDLNRILEIEKKSFTIDRFSVNTLRAYIENCSDLFFIAEVSNIVVGYMISPIQKRKGLVVSIAVEPKYRQQGIGKALVDFTINRLKSYDVAILELRVRKTNKQGISFWETLGFNPIKIIPNFYSDNTEALHMEKVLSPKSKVQMPTS